VFFVYVVISQNKNEQLLCQKIRGFALVSVDDLPHLRANVLCACTMMGLVGGVMRYGGQINTKRWR